VQDKETLENLEIALELRLEQFTEQLKGDISDENIQTFNNIKYKLEVVRKKLDFIARRLPPNGEEIPNFKLPPPIGN
jgi:hypothetical protein